MKTKIIGLAVSLLFIVLTPANTLAVYAPSLDIDFRDAAWGNANRDHSFSSGGVTATAFKKDWRGRTKNADLYQDRNDGLGIRGGENDEIDSWEWLEIDFDNPTFVTEMWLSDLFGPPKESPREEGYVKLFNGSSFLGTIDFSGVASGDTQVSIGQTLTGAIFHSKKVPKYQGSSRLKNTEYSVIGFNTSDPIPTTTASNKNNSVPDSGSTLILLGMGLVSFAAIRRFRANR